MWYGPDIVNGIDILETMSLLQADTESKIILTPFHLKYIELSISSSDKEKFMKKISQHYMEILTEYYRVNSTSNMNDESGSNSESTSSLSEDDSDY